MEFPAFFADAPTITLRDPLAAFLGVSTSGVMTYSYTDAVKLAGHSCPTVAGAYLLVRAGLARLYDNDLPERGCVAAYLRDQRDQGTAGVTANIVMLLTGAAPETGFGGIGADRRFSRRDLLHFGAPIDGLLALRRRDTGRGVMLDLDTAGVPAAREMQMLFPRVAASDASEAEQARFGMLWQSRVAQMLIEHADDPDLVQVREWSLAA
ncbi:MAG TPA: hypothetical protein VL154_17520 [Acetobacteraceae bacterium]|jgi:hypothetical protein|nr:hypothetical protein [Acetobacteraceae bacterium]